MRCIVLANGEYGNLDFYRKLFIDNDIVLCADGGANYAYKLGLTPEYIIGDMDSIDEKVKEFFNSKGVRFKKYPQRKDFTDMQLALALAFEMEADEVILLGTQGKRFDHSLSNLYCGIEFVKKGMKITHLGPECTVYLVSDNLSITGKIGDIVSVLPLGGSAEGAYLQGFEYSLENAVLECDNPYTVSNVLAENTADITVKKGVLAVFHYSA